MFYHYRYLNLQSDFMNVFHFDRTGTIEFQQSAFLSFMNGIITNIN